MSIIILYFFLKLILDEQNPWDVLQKQTQYHSTGKLSKTGENIITTEKKQKQNPAEDELIIQIINHMRK